MLRIPVYRLLLVLSAAGLVFMAPGSTAAAHEHHEVEMAVTGESLNRTVVTCSLNDYHLHRVTIQGESYAEVFVNGSGSVQMDQAGQPMLPVITSSLMIPDTARMEVRVLESEYYEIPIKVAPNKGPIPRSVDPASVPHVFGEVYGEDAFYPGTLAHIRDPFILREVRGTVLELYPFQYHPMQQTLRVYSHLKVEVVAGGEGSVNIIDRAITPPKPDRSFAILYQHHFANYGMSGRADPPGEDGDMLIISHGPFMAAMQPFVDWKNSIGIKTTMVDVAVVGNTPDDITRHIKQTYVANNLAYVLLVGDYPQVKCPTVNWGVSDPKYSCITPDSYPDIFVGRFSAESVADVETQVKRTIAYEQEGHDAAMGGWNARGLGIASNQGAGAGHYGESDDVHVDIIRDELLAYGFTEVERSYDPWGTKTIITNALNKGVRIVTYTGHGGPTGWGNGGGYSNSNVDALTNVGMLPFVSSVACNTGQFNDYTCFGEAWLRATHNGEPTGGIAFYGSSIGQSWAPPMYGQGNHTYNSKYGGVDRFWLEMQWSVCGCWYGGSCCMMEICGSSGVEEFLHWHCFGDPSLRISGLLGDETLMVDGHTVPLNAATDIHFTLCPGSSYGGYQYFLLGSVTGTWPGTPLPGGVLLPLNWDLFTGIVLQLANGPVFKDFKGDLDASGEAVATFSTQGAVPLDPRLAGTKLYFAGVVWPSGFGPFTLTTNPKVLTIVE